MRFMKILLTLTSLFILSTQSHGQVNEEFQRYVTNLTNSIQHLDSARAYFQSQALLDANFERELGIAKEKILLSSFNLGQWILPGTSYNDRRSRLGAFCDYNHEARLAWTRMNRNLGSERNQAAEWVEIFTKAKKDLPMPCD